jgi:hypothetical protein
VRLVAVATEVVLPDAHAPHLPHVGARAAVLSDDLSAGVRDAPLPAPPPHPHLLRFPSHVKPPFRRSLRRAGTVAGTRDSRR